MTVVGGVGEVDLLLHLLTNVTPFKQVWIYKGRNDLHLGA